MTQKQGLTLQINEDLRVICQDKMNYIPQQRKISPAEINKKPNPKAGTVSWVDIGYYPTLELALAGQQGALHHYTNQAGNVSIDEMIKLIKEAKKEIINAVKKN
jgi:hypothetical protein